MTTKSENISEEKSISNCLILYKLFDIKSNKEEPFLTCGPIYINQFQSYEIKEYLQRMINTNYPEHNVCIDEIKNEESELELRAKQYYIRKIYLTYSLKAKEKVKTFCSVCNTDDHQINNCPKQNCAHCKDCKGCKHNDHWENWCPFKNQLNIQYYFNKSWIIEVMDERIDYYIAKYENTKEKVKWIYEYKIEFEEKSERGRMVRVSTDEKKFNIQEYKKSKILVSCTATLKNIDKKETICTIVKQFSLM